MSHPELESLRAEIDAVDGQVIGLLGNRFRLTARVGALKAANSLAPVDPHREAEQQARFRDLATRNGVNPDLVVSIFRSVIDEVVKNHRAA